MPALRRHATVAIGAAVALGIIALGPDAATADAPTAKGRASAPPLAGQLGKIDHVRVFIDYLEIQVPGRGQIPENAAAGIDVIREGETIWSREFDSYLNIFQMGPVLAPQGADLTLKVWREGAGRRRLVAKIPFRVPGKAVSKTYSQGSLKKLQISTTPVDIWLIPDIPVVVPFALSPGAKKLLGAALVDFNSRLVDATDGQVRIAQLSVYEPPLPPGIDSKTPGAIHVHLAKPGKAPVCGRDLGRPAKPGRMALPFDNSGSGKAVRLGSALLHEFGHAYLGLDDEYLDNGKAVGCPDGGDEEESADADAACFLNAPAAKGREACRAGDHDENGDTAQTKLHSAACWTAMTAVLRADVGLSLLQGQPLTGPPPQSPPAVVFSSEGGFVDFGDTGNRLSDEAINEVIGKHGGAVGVCLQRTGERTAVIEFDIRGVDGRVTRTEVNGKTTSRLAKCVHKVMLKMRFPKVSAAKTPARVQISR